MLRYEQGRRQGLEKYCTIENGQALGARGGLYLGVCPPDLKESFKAAYHDGLQTHVRKLSAEISTLTTKQDSLRRELAAVEEQMSYLEKEVAQAGTGQARMMMGLISEMEMLEGDQMSLSLQIDALGMDLKKMRQRLYQIKKQADEVSK
jgi:outer membrane murein-binding lipoprotein Lpp